MYLRCRSGSSNAPVFVTSVKRAGFPTAEVITSLTSSMDRPVPATTFGQLDAVFNALIIGRNTGRVVASSRSDRNARGSFSPSTCASSSTITKSLSDRNESCSLKRSLVKSSTPLHQVVIFSIFQDINQVSKYVFTEDIGRTQLKKEPMDLEFVDIPRGIHLFNRSPEIFKDQHAGSNDLEHPTLRDVMVGCISGITLIWLQQFGVFLKLGGTEDVLEHRVLEIHRSKRASNAVDDTAEVEPAVFTQAFKQQSGLSGA